MIVGEVTILVLVDSVLQFMRNEKFYRFVKASQSLFQWTVFCNVYEYRSREDVLTGHNPCFSGQCFAMNSKMVMKAQPLKSQSLFQWTVFCNLITMKVDNPEIGVTILVLVDSVLQ